MLAWVTAASAGQNSTGDSTAKKPATTNDDRSHKTHTSTAKSSSTGATKVLFYAHCIGKAFLAQEVGEGARPAENRFREGAGNPGSADPRALHDRRSHRHVEPGQRRGHAPLPGGPRLAEQDRSRLACADQAGPGAEQGSSAESRKRHDHRSRCATSGVHAHHVAQHIARGGSGALLTNPNDSRPQ